MMRRRRRGEKGEGEKGEGEKGEGERCRKPGVQGSRAGYRDLFLGDKQSSSNILDTQSQ